ncbi:FadR/GntR family transcriptional regulator [Nocardioides sp. AN3]
MKFPPGKRARVVAGAIVNDITREGLERLPAESELLERYEISRPTLREGLRLLEMYGVITLKTGPGGGAVVNAVAGRDFATSSSLYFHVLGFNLADLMKSRLHLEPLMVRLAAERVKSGVAWPDGSPTLSSDGATSSQGDFHFAVAEFAGDPVLLLFAHALRDITQDISRGHRLPALADTDRRVAHSDIAKAIAAGTPTKAEALMREHIQAYIDLIATHSPHLLDQVIDWN